MLDNRAVRVAIGEYKKGRGCSDCGYSKTADALDLDHLPGTVKLFTISQATSSTRGFGRDLTWKILWDEVAKCDVVCANCHRERTQFRRLNGARL